MISGMSAVCKSDGRSLPSRRNVRRAPAKCDRRMIDIRLDILPQDLPWSTIGRRLVCKECGMADSVNIVPNWHDRVGQAVPFTKHWKT
jgi:hypothetical protein